MADPLAGPLTAPQFDTGGVTTPEDAGIGVPERLRHIERISGGTLPARMSLDLAQGDLHGNQLTRAVRMLTSSYDLSPDLVLKPYVPPHPSYTGVVLTPPGQWYADPVTGGPISLASARRFMASQESSIVRRWLEAQQRAQTTTTRLPHGTAVHVTAGVDPAQIGKIVAAFAPVKGETLALQDALGAAISIARDPNKVDLALFQQNLEVTAGATALSPTEQIAAAHTATSRGITLRTISDIPAAIVPGPVGQILAAGQAGQQELTAGYAASRENAGAGPVGVATANIPTQETAAQTAGGGAYGQLNIDYANKVAAGLTGPGDWTKWLHDQTLDYVNAGQEIVKGTSAPIPFSHSVVGRFLGAGLNIINRPLDAAWRIIISPYDPLFVVAAGIHDLTHPSQHGLYLHTEFNLATSSSTFRDTFGDARDIILGKTSATRELEKLGVPAWTTGVGEMALAFGAGDLPYFQRIIDPIGAGLQGWENVKARLLISGLAADGKSAESMARFLSWRDGPVARIGSLHNTNPVDYLIHSVQSSKDPEIAYRRAVDSFRTYTRADGIDPIVAGRVYDEVKTLTKLGVDDQTIHDSVATIFDAAFGVEPKIGSLAERIRSFVETSQAAARTSIEEEVGARLGVELQATEAETRQIALADRALATLDDSAFEAASGGVRMLEIPHRAGPLTLAEHVLRTSTVADSKLGREFASIVRETPRRSGPNLVVDIERSDAAANFDRVLSRGEVFSPTEIAAHRQSFAFAVDPFNPNRENLLNALNVNVNQEMIDRTFSQAHIGEDLKVEILGRIQDRLKGSPMDRIFGAFERGEEGQFVGIEQPLLASQLQNQLEFIDPVLLRQGITDVVGTVKKAHRSLAASLGMSVSELEASDAVKIPVTELTRNVLDQAIGRMFLSVWKPWIVLRPAHIARVVGVVEQGKFLAVTGLMRRLEAGTRSGPLMERLGLTKDSYLPMGVRLAEQANQRDSTIEDALLYLDGAPDGGIPLSEARGGFSLADRDTGHALATAVRNRQLGPVEREAALKLLQDNYASSLAPIGIDVGKLGLKGNPSKLAAKALENERNIGAGNLRLRVPGLLAPDPLARANMDRLVLSSADAATSDLRGLTPRMGLVSRDDPQFIDSYYGALQNAYGRDPVGRGLLRAVADGKSSETAIREQMTYLLDARGDGPRYAARFMGRTVGDTWTPADLRARLELTDEYVRSLAGDYPSVARAAAQGSLTTDALKAIPHDDLPLFVHGRQFDDQMLNRRGNPLSGLRDTMSRWILTEPTNRLTRQPLFKDQYQAMLKGLVETDRVRNPDIAMTEEKFAGLQSSARNYALEQVNRIMYDFSRTNRIDEMTRLGLVFTHPYMAFPITWGRILKSNPSFIREATLLGRAGLQSGFIKQDPETGEYVVPESWFALAAPLLAMVTGTGLGSSFKGGGWSLSAPLQSFLAFTGSAFPIPTGGLAGEVPLPLPPMNPLMQKALQVFVNRTDLPAAYKARLMSYLFQYGEITGTSMLPSWLRHGMEAIAPSLVQGQYDNDTNHFLQVQQAMGHKPDIGHAQLQAREFGALRAFFSAFFPAAPQVGFPTQELENEYRALIDTQGFQGGRDAFLKIHPDLTLLTIARTMWNVDKGSPVPLPATNAVNQLLSGKGAREFAAAHPEWVWAIIPTELRNGTFEPGPFFAQIASGQRVAKSPEAFLADADVQQGWDAFFNEDTIHTNWSESHPDIGTGDPGYVAETARHNAAIEQIKLEHPAWTSHFDQFSTQGVDPKVMAEARHLATDPMFTRTDVGQGLVAYIALRDKVEGELSTNNLTTLNSTAASTLGITSEYEQGVNQIVTEHPDFGTAYRLFFKQDLRAGVVTAGQKAADAIRVSDPGFYDNVLNPWWSQFETLKNGPDSIPVGGDKSGAFEAIRSFVNGAYDTYPDSKNPMILRWGAYSPTDKESYLASFIGRPYEYATRFDKQAVLGETTNSTTEARWTAYEQARSEITARNASDPNFSATAAYKVLDAWVLGQAKQDPTFAQQVANANTLGYTFAKVRTQLFGTSPQLDADWGAFLDGVGQIQDIVEKYQLTGVGGFDPHKAAVYRALQTSLQNYANAIGANDQAFAAQWALLENKYSGTDSAISAYFLPDTYFAIGSTQLVNQAAA